MTHRLQTLVRFGTRSFVARDTDIQLRGCRWLSHQAGQFEERTAQIGTFDNSKDAFRGKTTPELLRALLVFRLCAFDTLVAYQGKVCSNTTMHFLR